MDAAREVYQMKLREKQTHL